MSHDSRTFPLRSINKKKTSFFLLRCLVMYRMLNVYNTRKTTTTTKRLSRKYVFLIFFLLFFSFEKGTTDYHLPCFSSSSSSNFIQMIVSEEQRILVYSTPCIYGYTLYTCNTKGFWDFMWMCIDFIARVVLHLSNVK